METGDTRAGRGTRNAGLLAHWDTGTREEWWIMWGHVSRDTRANDTPGPRAVPIKHLFQGGYWIRCAGGVWELIRFLCRLKHKCMSMYFKTHATLICQVNYVPALNKPSNTDMRTTWSMFRRPDLAWVMYLYSPGLRRWLESPASGRSRAWVRASCQHWVSEKWWAGNYLCIWNNSLWLRISRVIAAVRGQLVQPAPMVSPSSGPGCGHLVTAHLAVVANLLIVRWCGNKRPSDKSS